MVSLFESVVADTKMVTNHTLQAKAATALLCNAVHAGTGSFVKLNRPKKGWIYDICVGGWMFFFVLMVGDELI